MQHCGQLRVLSLAIGLFCGGVYAADGDPATRLDEIVVTAQKREQNLQDVPISITALTGDALGDLQLTDSTAIARMVPNFEYGSFGGANNLTIRGVGNNDFNMTAVSPISVYRDGVVIGANAAQRFALLDIDRVEVLRGPQGTLFGKNTTGGALQYISKLPGPKFEGQARVTYGRFGRFEGEAAVTLPIAQDFSVRLAGLNRHSDGDQVNLLDGSRVRKENASVARAIVRYNPGDFEARLTIGRGRDRGDNNVPRGLGLINGANVYGYVYPPLYDIEYQNYDAPSNLWVDDSYANLRVAQKFGDFTLTSLTGYQDVWSNNTIDADNSPMPVNQSKIYENKSYQFTQELQLNYSGARANVVGGLYYFHEQYLLKWVNPYATKNAERENKAKGVYLQATYAISDDVNLTAGARYTDDTVRSADQVDYLDFIPLPDLPLRHDRVGDSAVDWRIGLDYKLAKDVMIYGTVSRGFKAGGPQVGVVAVDAARKPFGPEYLTSYEIGMKSTWLDKRLRANLSAFYYDYSDIQVMSVVNQNTGNPLVDTYLILENAGRAEIKGAELEVSAAPVDGLELAFNLGLNDAKYTKYLSGAVDPVTGEKLNYTGNRLPNTSKVNVSTSVSYAIPMGSNSLTLGADYSYKGLVYFNSAQNKAVSNLGAYGLLNLRASLGRRDGSWRVGLYATNVTGKKYITQATDLSSIGYYAYYFGPRPTFGGEVLVRF